LSGGEGPNKETRDATIMSESDKDNAGMTKPKPVE